MQQEFESWWDSAEDRLRAFLRSRRVHIDDIDDLVQRVAVRAITQPPFSDERHLVAWSVVVVKNLMADDGRRAARTTRALRLLHSAQASDTPVEDLAITRLKHERLAVVIEALPAGKRQALMSGAAENDPVQPVAARVAKHRVRRELRTVYERLGVGVASWRLAARRWWDAVSANGCSASAAAAAALVVIGAGVLGVMQQSQSASPDQDTPGASARAQRLMPTITETTGQRNDATSRATSSRTSQQAPVLRIGLGQDADGNDRSVRVRDRLPEESGAAICVGDPGAPSQQCAQWPDLVLALGKQVTTEIHRLRG